MKKCGDSEFGTGTGTICGERVSSETKQEDGDRRRDKLSGQEQCIREGVLRE
jgi:hypothetical protein